MFCGSTSSVNASEIPSVCWLANGEVGLPAVQAHGAQFACAVGAHRLAATGAREAVPSGGRAVRRERVELHQMHMQPDLDRQLALVERVGRKTMQAVVLAPFDDVAVIGARIQGLGVGVDFR